jgi:NAD binding domain of 6-phosphogluconate dehydrogenase
MLVKAGKPVDATIDGLMEHLEEGDIIIDGGNEWYENSERRMEKVADKGIRYLAMGVSGGEEGARRGVLPHMLRWCCPNGAVLRNSLHRRMCRTVHDAGGFERRIPLHRADCDQGCGSS